MSERLPEVIVGTECARCHFSDQGEKFDLFLCSQCPDPHYICEECAIRCVRCKAVLMCRPCSNDNSGKCADCLADLRKSREYRDEMRALETGIL
jgi:hypothetical protein